MEQQAKLSRVMYMSWEIQRTKHKDRSKALTAAWAILQNEDVTVRYLVRRHTTRRAQPERYVQTLSLFKTS